MNTRRAALEIIRVWPVSGKRQYFAAFFRLFVRRLLGRGDVAFNRLLSSRIVVKYEGLKFVLSPDSGLGPLFIKYYEPLAFASLSSTSGQAFIDIGANVGAYALRMASRYKVVIAVEPGHAAASLLRENLAMNGIENVTVMEKAVAKSHGVARLHTAGEIATWTLESDSSQYVDVPTVTLEEIIRPFERVDALKIDAEGSEVEILQSGGQSVERVVKIVAEARAQNCASVRSIFGAHGFKVIDLDSQGGIVLIQGERVSEVA